MKSFRLALVVMGALLVSGCGLAVVEDGEVGVKADFGHISDQALGPGWHWYLPVFSWVEVWDVKTQQIKETAQVPSSEGLISQLDVSVIYNVPPAQAVAIRKSIGRDYEQTVLEPYIREAIRNVVSGYAVKALYSDEGRKEIGDKILAFLRTKLEPRGFIVQDVLLRDVRLPPSFAMSIEAKLRAEQESFQKEFELTKAKKDAEIEVARATGVAKSNEIIAGSITENYLRYRWIEGLQTNQMVVIYVPTEANLPIMEAGRWKDSMDRVMKNQGMPAKSGQ
ncbi:MAG: prohibitin family protein [Candidatus Omnitrophica bacterium]|nr:prohibitin family protein [Candidatus Omnitrophota bacterium]